jgi:hypothetical protein
VHEQSVLSVIARWAALLNKLVSALRTLTSVLLYDALRTAASSHHTRGTLLSPIGKVGQSLRKLYSVGC